MAPPRKYANAGERIAAWRARKRIEKAEADRVYQEQQRAESARLREYARQDSILVDLARLLAAKRYPRGLPNGFAPAKDAQELIECALRHPEIVDKVLRACRVVDAEKDLRVAEARSQVPIAFEGGGENGPD